ncbi:hypothetical protein [Hyalangium minutum]|uniref:Uncharacterized protein n=1 Tax=Hyalangium minutum TaxID=394096 RepID=A0A085VXF4_9BACT|nr:hypothetical protein [Hyalangium minutum]KFE60117.1 hypothetical protein DB31_5988 [Hyalangium minutum]
MSAHEGGKALEQAYAQNAQLRTQAEEEFRKAVARQCRAGLTDTQILRVLRASGFKGTVDKVKAAREASGLPPNTKGGTE